MSTVTTPAPTALPEVVVNRMEPLAHLVRDMPGNRVALCGHLTQGNPRPDAKRICAECKRKARGRR